MHATTLPKSIVRQRSRMLGALACAALLAGCAGTPAQRHVELPVAASRVPLAPMDMEARLRDAAERFAQHGKVDRIAFYHVAAPADVAELRALGGNGVLLLTAVSQDAAELPPRRAYVERDGKQWPLVLLAPTRPQSPPVGSDAELLGAHRWDGLYVFPMALYEEGAAVTVDFAVNRNGFVVGRLAPGLRARLGYEVPTPVGAAPSQAELHAFIARQFPGFDAQP